MPGGALKEDCMKCNQNGYNRFWKNSDTQGFGQCMNCVGTLVDNASLCDWECPAGTFGNWRACTECNSDDAQGIYSSLGSCRQCSNMFYAGSNEIGGHCIGCAVLNNYNYIRKADCLRCNDAGYKRYWSGTYVDENSLGTCKLCNGTVSQDGTQCITE